MSRKVLSVLLATAMTASLLIGCGATAAAPAGGMKVGVAMPTKDLQRWNQDGSNMEEQLKAAGYEVDLQYASNDVQTQVSQIENMINGGCNVLVIASIDGESLGTVLETAKAAGIPVIAYDRLSGCKKIAQFCSWYDKFVLFVYFTLRYISFF